MRTVRRRAAVVLAVIGLGALGLAGPAGAEKAAPAHRAGQLPADDITGQDHPADVFAEAWNYMPPTVHVKKGGHIKFGNYEIVFDPTLDTPTIPLRRSRPPRHRERRE